MLWKLEKTENLDIGNLILLLLYAGLPHDWRLRHDVQPKQDVFLKVRPLDMDKLYCNIKPIENRHRNHHDCQF